MINGLSHITLIVPDLDEMQLFLVEAFEAKCVFRSNQKKSALSKTRFFDIGGVWLATIKGDPLPSRTYNHVAFHIDDADFERCQARLEAMKVDVLPPRPRVKGEGRSLYFYGPGDHLFELHAGTLAQRLAAYGPQG